MKYKILTLAIALGAGIVGYGLGRFQAGKAWNSFSEDLLYRREALEAQHSVRVLTYFRQGQETNALSILETFLDGQLGTLAGYEAVPLSERREEVLRGYPRRARLPPDIPMAQRVPRDRQSCAAGFFPSTMTTATIANPAASVDAPMASPFHIGGFWRRATEQQRLARRIYDTEMSKVPEFKDRRG
jgi:hypothetical protein